MRLRNNDLRVYQGVANKKWFDLAESAQDGPVTTKMIAEAKRLGVTSYTRSLKKR